MVCCTGESLASPSSRVYGFAFETPPPSFVHATGLPRHAIRAEDGEEESWTGRPGAEEKGLLGLPHHQQTLRFFTFYNRAGYPLGENVGERLVGIGDDTEIFPHFLACFFLLSLAKGRLHFTAITKRVWGRLVLWYIWQLGWAGERLETICTDGIENVRILVVHDSSLSCLSRMEVALLP